MLKNLFRKKVDQEKEFAGWEHNGRPVPPPHIVKQKAIKAVQSAYNIGVLVETGTYLGDMMAAQQHNFSLLYSIELSERLHKRALKRFKGNKKIVLLQGDSGKRIGEIVSGLKEAALFWLDGHYSGGITALGDKECPLPEELHAIFKSDLRHIILIDDARMFNGTQDYPTIAEIQEIIDQHKKNYTLQVTDDIIYLLPGH